MVAPLEDRVRGTALIHAPRNPFVLNTAELGSAELLAGGVNLGATSIAALLTGNPLALGAAGPIAEKFGFIAWELLKARERRAEGRTRADLLREGLSGFGKNLAADLAGHDPAYFAMMQLLLTNDINPVLASGISFLAGIPIAAGVQTLGGEVMHHGLRKISELQGFRWETYFETRFLLTQEDGPAEIFSRVSDEFSLGNENSSRYHDVYYTHMIPAFGNRLGLVRVRSVDDVTGSQHSYTDVELTYTLGRRHTAPASEFNLYYAHKEKGWLEIGSIDEMPLLSSLIRRTAREIRFRRRIRYDEEIRTVLDTVETPRGDLSILEIKAYHESDEFYDAMRYMLRHTSAMTTTHPKSKLVEII